MSLEAKVVGAGYAIGYPDLPHIMRLRAGRIVVDNVLNRQRKHLAAGIAGERRRLVRGEDNHDRAHDIGDGIGRDPAIVLGLVFVVVVCLGDDLLAARVARASAIIVVVELRSGALPLLGLFVALEGQWLDHDGCYTVLRQLQLLAEQTRAEPMGDAACVGASQKRSIRRASEDRKTICLLWL